MIPVDRAGSVTEMKLVSVHMATFSPLSEIPVGKTEMSAIRSQPALSYEHVEIFLKGSRDVPAKISETGPARSTGLISSGPKAPFLKFSTSAQGETNL